MTTAPHTPEPTGLLIRLYNQVGAAVDITGTNSYDKVSRWHCNGCGDTSDCPEQDYLSLTRRTANKHATACRAAYYHLRW
ncbi:hypothetical protein [Streptomyces benahoarensis]|uniref:Uncharacterized protein n=1 Tax=Streptomyces benahoarensis TaxID=2595054 RepID=A0A553XW79_9ACTN|nr:hypothetical protein [Streptomyces benahoarensis]TSB10096.1 hypothetical protein FNJ62_30755 [Streptomyces benahoarensis]TSB21218.1 hypothetical protein FNZ23_28525 [Streptomyces benahoarensis]